MKISVKKVLNVALSASMLAMLHGCGIFQDEKPVYLETPKVLEYNQKTGKVTWKGDDRTEYYELVYRVYDRKFWADDSKNYKTVVTKETFDFIGLDPETKDGDKVTVEIYANAKGFERTWSGVKEFVVEGKDHDDYKTLEKALQKKYQPYITEKHKGYVFEKALQFDYEYETGTIFSKVLAKNPETNDTILIGYEMNWETSYGLFDISSVQGFLENIQKSKYKLKEVYGGTVYESENTETLNKVLIKGRYADTTAQLLKSSKNFKTNWQYLTHPTQSEYGWEIGIIGEAVSDYVISGEGFLDVDFTDNVRYEYVALVPYNEKTRSPEEAIKYFHEHQDILQLANINKPSSRIRWQIVNNHAAYIDKNIYTPRQEEKAKEKEKENTEKTEEQTEEVVKTTYNFILPDLNNSFSISTKKAQKYVYNENKDASFEI